MAREEQNRAAKRISSDYKDIKKSRGASYREKVKGMKEEKEASCEGGSAGMGREEQNGGDKRISFD